jgi:hypothetical protein
MNGATADGIADEGARLEQQAVVVRERPEIVPIAGAQHARFGQQAPAAQQVDDPQHRQRIEDRAPAEEHGEA